MQRTFSRKDSWQQYEDVICGDVTSEFVNEYLHLYGEK